MAKRDGIARISIRVPEFYSSTGIDLLRRIAPYLVDGGGHERAFGITAKEENLPQIELELSNWRDELISGLDHSIWEEVVEVPSVEFDAVMENLIHLEPMEPGQGFVAFRGVLEDALLVGQEKEHLLLKLKDTPVKFLKLWSTEADLNLAREARGMKIDVLGGHFTDAMAKSWSVLSWRKTPGKPALVEEEVSPLAVVGCMGSGGGSLDGWDEDLEDEE
jgi:single-stranded DNA-specific DHH superfamily exonuclease